MNTSNFQEKSCSSTIFDTAIPYTVGYHLWNAKTSKTPFEFLRFFYIK